MFTVFKNFKNEGDHEVGLTLKWKIDEGYEEMDLHFVHPSISVPEISEIQNYSPKCIELIS